MVISRSIDLEMRNVSEKVVEKITTYISCSIFFFVNLPYMKACGQYGKTRTDHSRQYNTAHAHCMLITKATDTHSEYVIVAAFPRQQWIRERDSVFYDT
jgi:hypothetical protein